jgi:hypothetical protein
MGGFKTRPLFLCLVWELLVTGLSFLAPIELIASILDDVAVMRGAVL